MGDRTVLRDISAIGRRPLEPCGLASRHAPHPLRPMRIVVATAVPTSDDPVQIVAARQGLLSRLFG